MLRSFHEEVVSVVAAVAALNPPQILNPPCCGFIDKIPWWVFLIIHIVIFLFAVVFAVRAFSARDQGFGWGFLLLALAEISYMTYHVNITTFLFAHTVSEVLVLLAILTFAGTAARRGVFGRSVREAATTASPPSPRM